MACIYCGKDLKAHGGVREIKNVHFAMLIKTPVMMSMFVFIASVTPVVKSMILVKRIISVMSKELHLTIFQNWKNRKVKTGIQIWRLK